MTRKQRQKIIVDAYADWSGFGLYIVIGVWFTLIGIIGLGILTVRNNFEIEKFAEYTIFAIITTFGIYAHETEFFEKQAIYNALEDFEKNGKLTKLENAMLPSNEEKKE